MNKKQIKTEVSKMINIWGFERAYKYNKNQLGYYKTASTYDFSGAHKFLSYVEHYEYIMRNIKRWN